MENEILKQRLAQALELAKQGAYAEARAALEQLTLEAPESPEAFYYLGLACKRTHDPEAARTAWEKCLALDPFHHQARTQLSSLTKPAGPDFLTDTGAATGLFAESRPIPQVQPASLSARSLAFFIDSILLNLATVPFIAMFSLYVVGNAPTDGEAVDWILENSSQIQLGTTAIGFVVNFFFIPFFYYESGMTPGKRLLGMRIVDVSTLEPLTMVQSVGRFLASYLSTCVLYFGYLVAFFNKDRRALHDFLAGTYVASSETGPMSLAEKLMTTLLIILSLLGLVMVVIVLVTFMGGIVEFLESYPLGSL
ncbi:MAG: RDD family protein [Candidatus Omnitrophica bacterium]|nr:RDD family protein [Candidatus Omnitrophota bacterium]